MKQLGESDNTELSNRPGVCSWRVRLDGSIPAQRAGLAIANLAF